MTPSERIYQAKTFTWDYEDSTDSEVKEHSAALREIAAILDEQAEEIKRLRIQLSQAQSDIRGVRGG